MREFRGHASQTEYGAKIGKPQTVVSRLENPSYKGWSLATILEIARQQDVAVFFRFVDFPTFLRLSHDLSPAALHPGPYAQEDIDVLVDEVCQRAKESDSKASAVDEFGKQGKSQHAGSRAQDAMSPPTPDAANISVMAA
jgi:hypothetical protein